MTSVEQENVIAKLCFAIRGVTDSSSLGALRTQLLGAAREAPGNETISRQAIYDMFKNATPKRESTFRFLLSFVTRAVQDPKFYSELPRERKKVLGQIETFCRRELKRESHQEIYGTAAGHITIRQERIHEPSDFLEQMGYFAGTYRVFKIRFQHSKDKPISREFIQIERMAGHLNVRWWTLLDDKKPTAYRGALSMTATAVWAFLYNPSLGGRYRVFNATRAGWGRIQPEIYTGIILSTSPHPQHPRPVAARIFAEKVSDISEEEIRKELRHLDQRQLIHPKKDLVLKTISNSVPENGALEARDDLLHF